MGIFDIFKKRSEPAAPARQNNELPPAAPTAEEKNLQAISDVLAAIDKAVMSLSQDDLTDASVEKYTGECNAFRMQVSGIVPKADCTKIYVTLQEIFSELPQAVSSMPEEKLDEAFTVLRRSASALSASSTDLDREKAVLQLRYVKTDCVVAAMEFRIIGLNQEYDQTRKEMDSLIPDDPAEMTKIDKGTKFEIAQMKERLTSIRNTISAAEVNLDSLRVVRQQAENALRRLEIAPMGASVQQLVDQLSQEIGQIDATLGSQVEEIRIANAKAQEMFAEIKTQNREVQAALEETGAWKTMGADKVIEEVQQERAAEAAQQQQAAAETDQAGTLTVDE